MDGTRFNTDARPIYMDDTRFNTDARPIYMDDTLSTPMHGQFTWMEPRFNINARSIYMDDNLLQHRYVVDLHGRYPIIVLHCLSNCDRKSARL